MSEFLESLSFLVFESPIRIPFWWMTGCLWGSFLNVCIARLPAGENVVAGRSRCPRCAHSIRWYDNIPLLSFAILRGKCRDCALPISWRYPAVEAFTGVAFVATLALLSWEPRAAVYLPFVAMLIGITMIDLDHRIIPDELSLGGIVLGVIAIPLAGRLPFLHSLFGAALGYGAFFAIAYLYRRVRGLEGLGGGDVKMLGMIGAWLGPLALLPVVVIASAVGAVVGIAMSARRGKIANTAIPFGPFLAAGALAFLFAQSFWIGLLLPEAMP